MSDVNQEFAAIIDDLVSEEANDLLDIHLARTREWVAQERAAGRQLELRALIMQLHGEPSQRGPILAAYSAALWRLLEDKQ